MGVRLKRKAALGAAWGMAHLFISYSRTDRPVIEKLSAVLEAAGHSVWWDRHIRGGAAFAKDIEAQLQKADAVIVAWSSNANESDWVKDEAVYARDKGKLLPLCLADCEAPIGFRQYQSIDFAKWKSDPTAEPVQNLLNAIAETTGGAAPAPAAPKSIFQKLTSSPVYLGGAAVALLALAAFIVFALSGQGPENLTDEQDIAAADNSSVNSADVSIAVLPFADMSPEGNQEYFADGLSEELLNVLVRVDGLKVASRTSSFALKNEILSISDISERLNVNHVLEGSVRKMGNRVRITAQLIDSHDDKHLWSETYDRHLSDIFRIQDEIATAVVDALRDELGIGEDEEIVIKPATENLTAYDAYLKARELYLARGKANVAESMRLFEHAVEIDPEFARGWEGLAGVYAIATSWGILDKDYSAMALVAAQKALDIDPDLSAPYAVIGLTYRTHYPTPWAESIDNLQKAIERDPKVTDPRLWLGMDFLAIGEMEKAIEIFDGCLELDPSSKLCRKYRSMAYLVLGDFDTAMIDANANAEDGYYRDFDAYLPWFLERGDRLLAFTISRTVNWWGGFPHRDYIAAVEQQESQPADLFEKFKAWGESKNVNVSSNTNLMLTLRAYDEVTVGNFNNDYEHIWLPQFSDYRKSPQFKQLASDLGMLDYWREFGFPKQCQIISDADFECS